MQRVGKEKSVIRLAARQPGNAKQARPMMLSPAKSPRKLLDVTADWFWEGNVVKAIAHFLEGQGWSITSVANTETKAQGVDLRAAKNDRVLLVEAKGFPS